VKLSAMSAAYGPYCMSCGMSEATMAMKINTGQPVSMRPK
jgi:hypothetical protein